MILWQKVLLDGLSRDFLTKSLAGGEPQGKPKAPIPIKTVL